MQAETASAEMPRYQCHKEVWALKIDKIDYPKDGAFSGVSVITPADSGYAPFNVSSSYVSKHDPQPGGYYVVYDDGYRSYSPAAAFESGYRLITPSSRAITMARDQVRHEQFLEAVEREKVRLRAAKWWHRFVPFGVRITITTRK